jgi:gamma-glutamyltranspeptidase/glutathione hydrolase
VIAGVAAGHPATARAGVEILAAGGNAADAAVGAALASCVAETVMTGLLGGGHAIYYDAASGSARNLDFFCAVPGLGSEWHDPELVHLEVPFGAELVHYAVGPASCAVPGVPAGLGALWDAHGRLPWRQLLEPALELARTGVAMPEAHVACLRMLEPVMTLREGARMYAPRGALLEPGELLVQPGLVAALESLAAEGAAGTYDGTIGSALLELARDRGGLVTEEDLAAYVATWSAPVETARLGHRFLTRGGLSGVPDTIVRLPSLRALSPADRLVALVTALDDVPGPETHTTNLVTVDRDGNACVLTTSLGLGSGDWLPGLDLHLNSMLGETDLLRGALVPGARMHSMMAPTLVFEGDRLELAIGAAGGTRLRTALVTVAAAILDEGLEPQEAVDRPRVHVADGVANAEPGVDEDGLALLEARGLAVRRWPERHHYFGGVSASAAAGAAADPRRSGAALPAPAAG